MVMLRGRSMRILVVSDTHGNADILDRAILMQISAEIVIHLGDGEGDVEYLRYRYPEKMFIKVRGNCDFNSDLPDKEFIILEGKKIFITHGHIYSVKSGIYSAVCAAKEEDADILLFGHTHKSFQSYDEGLYILNPGSLKGLSPSYGIIDITDKGIVTNVIDIM